MRGGGSTSVDITTRGIDKAYGMLARRGDGNSRLEMLFIGDADPGGDYR